MTSRPPYLSKSIVRAILFLPNVRLALEKVEKETDEVVISKLDHPVKIPKVVRSLVKVCAKESCAKEFMTNNKRRLYCSDSCRNTSAVKRHKELQKELGKFQRTARLEENDLAWRNYEAAKRYDLPIGPNGEALAPPKLRGRPTRKQRQYIHEFEEVLGVKIVEKKKNRHTCRAPSCGLEFEASGVKMYCSKRCARRGAYSKKRGTRYKPRGLNRSWVRK